MMKFYDRIHEGRYICDVCALTAQVTVSRFPANRVKHDCRAIEVSQVGTYLRHRFQRLGFFQHSCGCRQLEWEMNARGWQWCESNSAELIERIYEHAKERLVVKAIPAQLIKDRIASNLMQAIERAKNV